MKYKFEKDIERNRMSMDVVNARRFARAVREAIDGLEHEARCYGLKEEDYYLDAKVFLEDLERRLSAKPGEKHTHAED